MQRKHVLISMLAVLTFVLSVVNTSAWVYPEPTPEDTLYEDFGPRVDRVLIKLYATSSAEFTGLEAHEIDLTDWPLTPEWKTRWDDPTYNEYIKKVSYPDYGFRVLDLNNNGTTGYPRIPCVTREIPMRQAIACLVNKDYIIEECVDGQGYPLWSLFGPGWTVYQHPDIMPGGSLEDLCYLYNCTRARQILTNDPIFRFVSGTSDYGVISIYGDHLEWKPAETGVWEDVWLKFFIREDRPQRKCTGNIIAGELADCLGVYCDITYVDSSAAKLVVMTNKDFHMYTGGWTLNYDPNWAWYLYSIEWYWSGRALNYDRVNNTNFEYWSYILAHAKNESQAIEAALECAEALATETNIVPLWETQGTKAYHRTCVGPEAPYTGANWTHLVNEIGDGINSFWGILNMYPEGHPWGDGENMTLRYGLRVPELDVLNPLYSEFYEYPDWYPDWKVLGLIYGSLLYTNPCEPSQWLNYLTTNYTIGTYEEGGKTYNKMNFVLNDTVYWSDGVPFTTADVKFTLHDCEEILATRRCPEPLFSENTAFVKNVTIHDAYNCTVCLTVESIYAWQAVGRCPMIPKHIWEPIINTASCDDLQGWGPDLDPGMVGTGPFLFIEYIPASHILLATNPRYFRLPPEHRTSPPIARLTPKTFEMLVTPVNVTLNASTSVSAFSAGTEHPIAEYRWDLDNDGTWDNIMATPNITITGVTYAGYMDLELPAPPPHPIGCSWWRVTVEIYAPTAPAWLQIGRITNIIHFVPTLLPTVDFDGDWDIDIDDIRYFVKAYIKYWTPPVGKKDWEFPGGTDPDQLNCDFDNDCDIDIDDIRYFAEQYTEYYTPT